MAFTFVEQTAVTVSTSAIGFINGTTTIATDTTQCMVQPWVDPTNMAAGTVIEVRLHEKARSGGTQRITSLGFFSGAQNGELVFPAVVVGNGWDFSIIKISGADTAFDFGARKVT